MKCLALLILTLSTLSSYAQRSSWNREDRKYLCDKLNAFFYGLSSRVGKPNNKKLWDENDPRLLSDTFEMAFNFKPQPCAEAKKSWNERGGNMALALFVKVINEFPQYKAIRLLSTCIEKEPISVT